MILKRLNVIRYIDPFLNALDLVLLPEPNFIGYFSDYDAQNGSGLISMTYKGSMSFWIQEMPDTLTVNVSLGFLNRMVFRLVT